MLADIEKHEARVSKVLSKHEKLRSRTGDVSPTHAQELTAEIKELKDKALKHRDQLREALQQQEAYDEEVTELYQNIEEAQMTLQETPIQASSAQGLQQQIADHNVCLALIIMSV